MMDSVFRSFVLVMDFVRLVNCLIVLASLTIGCLVFVVVCLCDCLIGLLEKRLTGFRALGWV